MNFLTKFRWTRLSLNSQTVYKKNFCFFHRDSEVYLLTVIYNGYYFKFESVFSVLKLFKDNGWVLLKRKL